MIKTNLAVNIKYLKSTLLVIAILLFLPIRADAHNVFPLYAYHLKPPFIIDVDKEQGLYFDLARVLNQKQKDIFFKTVFMPRNRLDLMIEQGKLDGAVIGVSPIWFKDKSENKYFWTENFFSDRDEVISLKEKAIEFDGPQSITGKKLGGVMGFSYFGINALVEQGKIYRDDTIGEKQILMMILTGRVDIGIVSLSTYSYLLKNNPWQGRFYLSKKPHDEYQRRVLVPKQYIKEYAYIHEVINRLPENSLWQRFVSSY